MSSGLLALLDDVAGIAKIAAASVDDAAAQAAKAGAKAAGIVIDDAAVTPRYVVGFAASRELPIIGKIALGSLKNKLLYLLPAALLLSIFAPWAITPLLMAGGAYLCFEGFEKVLELVLPHHAHAEQADADAAPTTPEGLAAFEDRKVSGAISTDFILSAEIMAITLASIDTPSVAMKAAVLAAVGIGVTVGVYGAVALIVKADDAGVALARKATPLASLFGRGGGAPGAVDRAVAPLTQAFGRGLVHVMPRFLAVLSAVGTAAMLWVGGGIIVHGLEQYGFTALGHWIHDAAAAVGRASPVGPGVVEWLAGAAGSAVVGIAVGALALPVVTWIIGPLARLLGRGKAAGGPHG